jgi:ubiquinone/menaquinone biosynthesis C-methylase UbiE
MGNKEIERIKEAYELRKNRIPSQMYSFFNPANLFMIQRRECEILKILNKIGINSLENKRILDVGCGAGGELRNFIRYGALPENCFGIDLLPDRIESARKISPNIDFRCGDASTLPFEDKGFDIVLQYTVFTSILDDKIKEKIAREMLRVLTPNGIIVWYDFYVNNPKNSDVRGVKKGEIHRLFPRCKITLKRITLAPPVTRIIAPLSIMLCLALEKISFLRTHYIGIIKKTH